MYSTVHAFISSLYLDNFNLFANSVTGHNAGVVGGVIVFS